MGRLIGYMANRHDSLRDALHQERNVLDAFAPADEPAGWGIGFYQSGEVLHKKRPRQEGETLSFRDLANGVRSDCVVAHLRQPTVGDFRTENMHPFRMRSWIFAHSGTIEGFEAIRDGLLDSIPDFLRRNIRGQTDSEPFFHLILSFLHDEGQLDNPDIEDGKVVQAIRSAIALVDRLAAEVGAPPGTVNHVLTNGRRMYATARGAPMIYVQRDGIHDPAESVEVKLSTMASPASGLRYVLILTGGADPPPDWTSVEDGSVVIVRRDLQLSTIKL